MLRFTTFQVSVLSVLLFLLGFGSYRIYVQGSVRHELEQQILTQDFQALPEPVGGAGPDGAPIEKLSGQALLDLREHMKINVNTAEVAELNSLPGIGPSTAQAIIDYRKENGPFQSIDDLEKVKRIGSKLVDKIREHVTTGTPEPPGASEPPVEGPDEQALGADGLPDTSSIPEESLDAAAADAGGHASSRPAKLTGRVDVNTASAAELELLPKIGPATAKAIIEYRNKNGPFRSAEDLAKVKRIGAKTVENLRPHITLSGAVPPASGRSPARAESPAPTAESSAAAEDSTAADGASSGPRRSSRGSSKDLAPGQKININTASEAELTRLPGVGPATAQKIVEQRAVNGPFKTIEDIMKIKGIGKAKFAKMQEHLTVQ